MIVKINSKSLKILFATYLFFTSLANAVLVIDVQKIPHGKYSSLIRIVCLDTGEGINIENHDTVTTTGAKFVFIEYRVFQQNSKTLHIDDDFQEKTKFPISTKMESGVIPVCYDGRGRIFI